MDEGLSSAVEARRGSLDMGTSTVGGSQKFTCLRMGIRPVPNPNRRLSSDLASFQDVREGAEIWSGTYSSLKLPQKLKKL